MLSTAADKQDLRSAAIAYARGLHNSIKMAELMVTPLDERDDRESGATPAKARESNAPSTGASAATPIAVSTPHNGMFARVYVFL